MLNKSLFESKSQEWETPAGIFDPLNQEFHFTLDVCASVQNHKCDQYFDKEHDSLSQDWTGRCWMNPPYGRQIARWIQKARLETDLGHADIVVCLLPARTDTKWWHEYVTTAEIRFLKGRIRFVGATSGAPFPSAIVIFRAPPVMVSGKDGLAK